MKLIKFIGLFVVIILLGACSHKNRLSVTCEQDEKDNFYLKWELYPEQDGIPIDIYMSDNDSIFPDKPEKTVSSENYILTIPGIALCGTRRYFQLKAKNTTPTVVTNRFFLFDRVLNFRDIGGYLTSDNKTIRWGKIYRSGSYRFRSEHDTECLNSLNLKTLIDIQSHQANDTIDDLVANKVRIPISIESYATTVALIKGGCFFRGDAMIYAQDIYKHMIYNCSNEFALIFDYLADESNYPVAINCSLGKDQTGLTIYWLLRALDVPAIDAENDYMLSNVGIDKLKLVKDTQGMPETMQEALTIITHTERSLLKYGIYCMRQKSGSVDQYMTNELRLTSEKRAKLKKILLY